MFFFFLSLKCGERERERERRERKKIAVSRLIRKETEKLGCVSHCPLWATHYYVLIYTVFDGESVRERSQSQTAKV